MKTISALTAAGGTHPGLHRDVNEDRWHIDVARGLFLVVDGVGGQAAGGKAADIAIGMLRARLERETGTISARVREAIAVANNEIRRVASVRPEWHGMACVLTVAVVEDGRAVVGHVGDTRLYKLRNGRIEKVTRDHSPVGEREDAHEISETEAMRHPRRNEVYRDVGSERHEPDDADFIDLIEIPFEQDAALVLCSDGLTDLIDSRTILDIATNLAGRPRDVVAELIEAANDAGGKDNVTVVYVEGEQFGGERAVADRSPLGADRTEQIEIDRPEKASHRQRRQSVATKDRGRGLRRILVLVALIGLLATVAGYALYREGFRLPASIPGLASVRPATTGAIVVRAPESISAAIAAAAPGATVVVEPGEYRERLVLAAGVRVVSRIPRAATIRLPSAAAERDPAVVADGIAGAELTGFRIVGDAATPLGTGLFARNSDISVVDLEITGAATAAIDLGDSSHVTLLASHIHDNPGAALAIRAGATPRISQNVLARNGLSEQAGSAVVVDRDARPAFFGNVFSGIAADAFRPLGDAAAAEIVRDNWFVDARGAATPRTSVPRGRGRR